MDSILGQLVKLWYNNKRRKKLMSIKLTILKTGETIISEMQELVSNNEQTTPHAYLLNLSLIHI